MKIKCVLKMRRTPENGSCEENDKAAHGGILKVGDLKLTRPADLSFTLKLKLVRIRHMQFKTSNQPSVHLNSTLQPILSPGGGGLNLIVCLLVD